MSQTTAPVYYETHMHTPLCGHAEGEPEAYAMAAAERGLKGIIVTCHNPLPNGYAARSRMAEHRFGDYLAMVDRARERMRGVVDVRLGLECDFVHGMEDWLRRQLASADFHYVLGSVHPQLPEYREAHWRDDPEAFQRGYFDHLADAAESGLYDALSHPDLVKNFTKEDWELPRVLDHVRRNLDRIAATGCAMELNTSGLNKAVPEMNPSMEILREMAQRGIPVVIGADAHQPERVGDRFELALDALERVGYRQVSLFLERQRQDLGIDGVRRSLRAPSIVARSPIGPI